jgi:4-hydroxy-tetrahydrodipicolinate synthase
VRRDVITAVPVAFHRDGTLDLEGSRAILRHVRESGNEGAFVLGTTGEFPALDVAERDALVRASVEELGGTMRVIAHVGAPSLFEVRRLVEGARAAGAREIAVITPYYLPATDAGLVEFYREVADAAAGLDVYVYVFRDRTQNPVSPEVMATLSRIPGIVGAKVSGEPLETLRAYRAVVPAEFVLYTGSDTDLARAADAGAQGVVSGVSSVLPKPFRALKDAADAGDPAAVEAAQADVDAAVQAIAGDIARMKAAYEVLGVPGGTVRMAIDAPDEAELAAVKSAVARLA